jgi:hypothetical protein
MGQKLPWRPVWAMFVLYPEADIQWRSWNVCSVPIADIKGPLLNTS